MSFPLAHAAAPVFEFGYAATDKLEQALADPRVLAVFGFAGCPRPALDDPRFLSVPLQIHGMPVLEVWRSPLPVTHGRDGDVAWAHDGQVLFGSLEIDEADAGIEAAAAAAYARLALFLDDCGYPHLLRTWNYLDAITEGEGDEERYRRFCVGRARGMHTLDETSLPAATCIGRYDGVRRLQVYWLCGRDAGQPLENPRQINPWHYPQQYGRQSPSFSRALLPAASSGLPLLQSGTAAIIGHASQHPEALPEQLHETLANLQSLIDVARQQRPALAARPGPDSLFKVYVRRARDLDTVAALLQALPQPTPCLLLHAEVCRRELLVEIESLHGDRSE
ncbi:MAG: pteridine-dependent deoxygenase [Stenotrophomonas sp.]